MSPLLISILVFAAIVLAGTVLGALAFVGVGNLLRSPVEPVRAHGASFVGSITAAMFYAILVRFMDNPEEPLIGGTFFIAAGAGLAVSFIAILKSFEIEMSKVPLMWLPFGAALALSFYLARTLGDEWREANGFHRGFESVANLNMLDPPDAMSTPEKAINYYNNQYARLQKANEDEGIGKIFTTATHWDAKWFNQSYPFIVKEMSKTDRFGITQVVQDPKQQRMMALGRLARPIYGKLKDVYVEGSEALVLMDSGQLVRLYKSGKNWKVRDWLGMRPMVMQQIHDLKERNDALTEEDKRAHEGNYQHYEVATREMAERAKFPYTPYSAILAQPKPGESNTLGTATGSPDKSKTGYRKLDAAPPGALVDLQKENKEDSHAPATQGIAQAGGTPALPGEAQANGAAAPAAAGSTATHVDFAWPAFFAVLAKADRGDASAVAEFLQLITAEDRAWFQTNAMYLADLVAPNQQRTPAQAQLAGLQALARTMPRAAAAAPRVVAKGAQGAAQMNDASGKSHVTLLAQENGKWVLAHPFFARTYTWVPLLAKYKRERNIPLGADEQAVLTSGIAPVQQQVQQIFNSLGFTP